MTTGNNFYDTKGNDILIGSNGDDTFNLSRGGIDTVHANGGDDQIVFSNTFGPGDEIDGGDGVDTLSIYLFYTDGLFTFTPTTVANIENLYLSPGSASIATCDATVPAGKVLSVTVGSHGRLFFDGSAETDGTFLFAFDKDASSDDVTLIGGIGNDTVIASGPHVFFDGGLGDDTIDSTIGNVDTVLYTHATSGITVNLSLNTAQSIGGGQGTDTLIAVEAVIASVYDDVLIGNASVNYFRPLAGNDIVDGGAGSDWVNYWEATSGVTVNLSLTGAQTIGGGMGVDTLINIENAVGGSFDDTLIGNSGDNYLSGGAGDDYFVATPGEDTYDGSFGLDTLTFENAPSGVGVTLSYRDPAPLVTPGWWACCNAIDNVIGSAYDDYIYGDYNPNCLYGGAGCDTLSGYDGNDTLSGGGDGDLLIGMAGTDTIDGGSNIDTARVYGNRSDYTLTQTATGVWQIVGLDGTDTMTNIEYVQFWNYTSNPQTIRLLPGSGTTVNWSADPSTYMTGIRDFDGNNLGSATGWKLIGTADVNGDGTAEHILVNRLNGRWAEVSTESDGKTYFANNGWAGDTRVIGIYIDPLVTSGEVVAGSDTDSQRRFQNDLNIENIHGILGQNDYNHDGLQEIYFSLTDGTAYLHAYMHADGNIQYANYQNESQVKDYLVSNGFTSAAWAGWFPVSQALLAAVN